MKRAVSFSQAPIISTKKGRLTVSVPLGQGGQIGEVGDHHHVANQTDGATLNAKADWEVVDQGHLQLAGVDLGHTGHCTTNPPISDT